MATFKLGGLVEQVQSTATAGGTTTLTNSSKQVQVFTGTSGQTIKLPDATTMVNGQKFEVYNTSTAALTVQYNDASAFGTVSPSSSLIIKLSSNGTSNGTWVTLSSGSGSGSGSKNYFSALSTVNGTNTGNGDFELGATTGWSLAHSTLTSLIPTSVASAGTAFDSTHGGSAASGNLSFTTVSSSQLAGKYSGSLVSSAASTAGDLLISAAAGIDTEDQAKSLNFSFSYKAVSGTFNMSGTSSNTHAVYIYDVTNAAWIQPAGVYNIVQSSGVGKCTGTFQTSSNGLKYQIALININATGGAYTLYLDNFTMGPVVIPTDAAISDEVSASGLLTPNSGKFGTIVNPFYFWRRVGNMMEVRGEFTAGTIAAGTPYLTLNGYTIDSNLMSSSARDGVGSHWVLDNGGANFGSDNRSGSMYIDPANNTRIFFSSGVTGNTYNAQVAGGTSSAYAFKFSIPITGWSSNSVMSADTDTRVCVASYYTSTGKNTSTTLPIDFDTKSDDTHAVVTTGSSWKFTAPISGWYQVDALLRAGGTSSATNWTLYKNGTAYKYAGYSTNASTTNSVATVVAKLNAGDFIDLRGVGTVDVGGGTLASSASQIDIFRLTGPAVVTASESVNLMTTLSGNNSYNNGTTTVIYDTKVKDSHGTFDTSTGQYTIPVSGMYYVQASIQLSPSGAIGAGQAVRINAVQTGSASVTRILSRVETQSSTVLDWYPNGSTLMRCQAGDIIKFQVVSGMGTCTTGTDTTQNYMSIYRTGNY